jgi:endonuclease/exonuclease/phosphatase family metal-dependent hydrolase
VDTQILTFNRNGQYPSDHFPVIATLRWTGPVTRRTAIN